MQRSSAIVTPQPPSAAVLAAVARLGLEAHPEGGYFKRIYTSPFPLQPQPLPPPPPPPAAPRACASAILFLLPRGGTSSLHALGSDELWLHQGGAPLTVVQVQPGGGGVAHTRVLPGAPHCVPAGDLFGAFVGDEEEEAYALVCCVVVPGFLWEEFSMPPKGELLARFAGSPAALREVERLCR